MTLISILISEGLNFRIVRNIYNLRGVSELWEYIWTYYTLVFNHFLLTDATDRVKLAANNIELNLISFHTPFLCFANIPIKLTKHKRTNELRSYKKKAWEEEEQSLTPGTYEELELLFQDGIGASTEKKIYILCNYRILDISLQTFSFWPLYPRSKFEFEQDLPMFVPACQITACTYWPDPMVQYVALTRLTYDRGQLSWHSPVRGLTMTTSMARSDFLQFPA